MRLLPAEFESLLLGETQWIDVRAPIEFAAGHVPGAINLPLLNDEERHTVGVTYKRDGREAAVTLGHQMVSGEVRDLRLRAWQSEAGRSDRAVVYCFRGGMRSQIVQSWLHETGIARPIVAGGYKALRRFFLEILETRIPQMEFAVVSGPTGSGKTAFLVASGRPFIDLEALAAHRGSAFGRMDRPQPSQPDFENALALEVLRLSRVQTPVLIENESRLVGDRAVPDVLYQKIRTSPKIELMVSLEERVENIYRDYIVESSLGRQNDLRKFADFKRAVGAISRRLGGIRTAEILDDLNFAQTQFMNGHGLSSNRVWIRKLLEWYYDPRYAFARTRPT